MRPLLSNIIDIYQSNFMLGVNGNAAGRDRHGPTGASYVRTEHQDTYMTPGKLSLVDHASLVLFL